MDIDDELQMLQRQLMEVQQQKTNPLSERTVAEIMIKLHQDGFRFYTTVDGNQFITPQKIDNEIIQFVKERGRTKIGILPQLLNLNNDLVQSRINLVCQKSTHIRSNDNLISKEYLKGFVHSLKQQLQTNGIVNLDEICINQQFNKAFITKIINQNLQELDAEVIMNQLVTKQYHRMKKKRIFGFLLPINKPVSIDTVLKNAKLNDHNSQKLIQQLISEGKLKGRCQNSYYIPNNFSKNQKQIIQQFFQNNGYVEFSKLQKVYQVPKPQEWIKKNLKGNFIIFQQVCFGKSKLQQYQSQIQSLLKGEGFFQISMVIPFDLEQKKLERFLTQSIQIKDFEIVEGYCFSENWINKCVSQFRDKVIYDIFFKKTQPKQKKKNSKKEKEKQLNVTQQQLTQTLFDAGLAQYSVAQALSPTLVPLITEKLIKLKSQLQGQLNKSKGLINNAFMKYRKCKTIIKTSQNLQRVVNTIQKQKKKGQQQEWSDPDFGPTKTDPNGKYSLIYYDGITVPQWPTLQNINWAKKQYKQILSNSTKSKMMNKSLFYNLMEIILNFNSTRKNQQKLSTPNVNNLPAELKQEQLNMFTPPYVFKYYIGQNDSRFVLVDDQFPCVDGEIVTSGGIIGLMEKAYAKLRFCYKAILQIGLAQTLFQILGTHPVKIPLQNQKDEDKFISQLLQNNLADNNLVIVMAEGTAGKKIKVEGNQTQFRALTPYQISRNLDQPTQFKVFPGGQCIQAKAIPQLFKNIYLIKSA